MSVLTDKINVSRFCDLQGATDMDRRIATKNYKNLVATYEEWYNTFKKDGFTIGDKKNFETETEKKK